MLTSMWECDETKEIRPWTDTLQADNWKSGAYMSQVYWACQNSCGGLGSWRGHTLYSKFANHPRATDTSVPEPNLPLLEFKLLATWMRVWRSTDWYTWGSLWWFGAHWPIARRVSTRNWSAHNWSGCSSTRVLLIVRSVKILLLCRSSPSNSMEAIGLCLWIYWNKCLLRSCSQPKH